MGNKIQQILLYLCLISTIVLFALCWSYDIKANNLEVILKASKTLNEGLLVTNKFLQVKYDNLVGKKEGYNYFGYWIEMPEEQDVHVLINYPEDYPLNEFRRMLLREHHRYGLKEIKAKDWNEEQ